MNNITNEELGVALIADENGNWELRTTRPRTESMLTDERVQSWAAEEYKKATTQQSYEI